MAVQLLTLWGHIQRQWGYEIRADFGDGSRVFNEVLTFPSEPSQAAVNAAVALSLARVEASLAVPAPQYQVTNEDGTTTLV